ncbi:hypothetical protein SCHPADRAFT_1003083 [Schizopora paradoxa]|uniref:Uncharacterized protein n=1 Tax=Schizopora paradoxa TaxID=27342 RepID=A0A0H2R036_9AGAM|nr:hypothetical protein SCHPADRAFT_1003083 [Schizopora paradoxa]
MSFAFLAHPPSPSQLNSNNNNTNLKPSKLSNVRSSILPKPKGAQQAVPSGDYFTLAQTTPRRPSVRRRSATVSGTVCSISAWASTIVPGSPAPCTPRTPRTPRTPPLSALAERLRSASASASSPHVVQHKRRRSSVSNNALDFLNLLDTPSTAAYISICTPSPSHLENKPTAPSVGFDLQAQGYTTVFVRLPGTPVTPHTAPLQDSSSRVIPNPSLSEQIANGKVPSVHPVPKTPTTSSKKAFTRLRSLSFKTTKKGSMFLSQHHSSSSSSKHAMATSSSSSSSKPKQRRKSSAASSTPHARYGHLLAPAGGAGALPLAQEVQLSQMLDGGSVDANVKRVAKRHAKDTGAAVSSKKSKSREDAPGDGVSGVYRDGRGGMFWDEDEAFELAGLLKRAPSSPSPLAPAPEQKRALGLGLLRSKQPQQQQTTTTIPADWVDPTRRGSESAASDAETTRSSSIASELGFVVRPLSGTGAGVVAASAFVPGYRIGMGPSTTLPSLHPGDAFNVPPNSKPDEPPMGPPKLTSAARERPRARHRPAPLTLTAALPAPSAPPPQVKSAPARRKRMPIAPLPLPNAVADPRAREVEEGRKDFFASSFSPPLPAPATEQRPSRPAPTPLSSTSQPSATGTSKSGRRLSFNMGLGTMISSTARTVRRASASLGAPSPGPLTAVTGKFNNGSSVHVNARAAESATHLHALAYGQNERGKESRDGSTKSRASSSSSKTLAPAPPPLLRTKVSKLKLSSLFHRGDKSSKA